MEDRYGHKLSYLRVSITDRCNERCKYCMPDEEQVWFPRAEVLSYEELERVIRVAAGLGMTKLRITGGEPLVRRDAVGFIESVAGIDGIKDLGVSTNGTLLARRGEVGGREDRAGFRHEAGLEAAVADSSADQGPTVAMRLAAAGVRSVNISIDTLDRAGYQAMTGRDYLPRVLEGIDAAIDARIPSVKLNAVLYKGQSEEQLLPLIRYAGERGLVLRFIELMPVSTREVLDDHTFLSVGRARKLIESELGPLQPRPDHRTNGPSVYFQIPGSEQLIGFIGAMTDLHFCERCNKLRLTCDGKLRPCLGSWLEFDLRERLRAGADDSEIADFFRMVVDRKPEKHDFLDAYQPGRRMVAIGG